MMERKAPLEDLVCGHHVDTRGVEKNHVRTMNSDCANSPCSLGDSLSVPSTSCRHDTMAPLSAHSPSSYREAMESLRANSSCFCKEDSVIGCSSVPLSCSSHGTLKSSCGVQSGTEVQENVPSCRDAADPLNLTPMCSGYKTKESEEASSSCPCCAGMESLSARSPCCSPIEPYCGLVTRTSQCDRVESDEGSGDSISWGNLPSTVLEQIYASMRCCDRLQVSAVNKKWRSCLYSPRLWWNVNLRVSNRKEGNKAFFLSRMIHFARNIRIHWAAVKKHGRDRDVVIARPDDLHIKETLKVLFRAMRRCRNITTLVLKLENPCAFSPDFSKPVQEDLAIVCQENLRLHSLSFGCNSTIIPPGLLDLLPDNVKHQIRYLHVARHRPEYSESSLECVPYLGDHVEHAFSLMRNLQVVTLDWANVSSEFLRGLTATAASQGMPSVLRKLNILVASHHCTAAAHPSAELWARFANCYPDVHIHLAFVWKFAGMCPSLEHVRPGVFMVKMLECAYVDPDEFSKLLSWHRDSVQSLVHVGAWRDIELETGPALWPSLAVCRQIQHLAFVGHFILDEILVFIASLFHGSLRSFVVSKAHIMMLAQATSYLLPTSASKYNQFKQEVGALLQRPWEAVSHVPLEGFYFAEGHDDDFYLREAGPQHTHHRCQQDHFN